MALTFGKWLAGAAVGCGMVWFGIFHRPSFAEHAVGASTQPTSARSTSNDSAASAKLTMKALAQANDHLRVLELRDSVMQGRPAERGLSITFDSSFAADTRAHVEAALRARWASLRAGSQAPVTIAFVTDSTRSNHGLPRSRTFSTVPIETFLPSAETRGACVALVHVPYPVDQRHDELSRQSRANLFSRETIEAELSPCAFYASFGEPGPAIARWLVANRWGEIRLAGWDSVPAPWRAAVKARFYSYGFTDALMISADPAWEIRRYVAPSGIACLAAEATTCAKILLGSRELPADSSWRSQVVSSGGTNRFAFYLAPDRPPLGPSVGLVLSEMVRTLGPVRFEKFWRSTAPVDQAFAQATGMSVEAWTHSWTVGMYGVAAVGPALTRPGLIAGIIVLALGVIVACILEARRTVV